MSEPLTRLNHYRLLGSSGLRVSPLCLGTMTFGTAWGWGADEATSRAIFERYAEAGGNFIDTANFYTEGTSERFVADFVGSERDRYVIATKFTLKQRDGDPNAAGNGRKSMRTAVEASLRRLRTDYLDLYWVHAWDFTAPVEEVIRGLDDLVRAGKVLHVGASDTPSWVMARANTLAAWHGWSPFVAAQVPYSLARRDVERDLLPFCRLNDVAALPWSPLAGGVLSGKYDEEDIRRERELIETKRANTPASERRIVGLTPEKLRVAAAVTRVAKEAGRTPAQVAINWLLTRAGVTSVILGARTVDQIEDNLQALDFTLEEAHLAQLDEASAIPLGFPLDFLTKPGTVDMLTAGTEVQRRL